MDTNTQNQTDLSYIDSSFGDSAFLTMAVFAAIRGVSGFNIVDLLLSVVMFVLYFKAKHQNAVKPFWYKYGTYLSYALYGTAWLNVVIELFIGIFLIAFTPLALDLLTSLLNSVSGLSPMLGEISALLNGDTSVGYEILTVDIGEILRSAIGILLTVGAVISILCAIFSVFVALCFYRPLYKFAKSIRDAKLKGIDAVVCPDSMRMWLIALAVLAIIAAMPSMLGGLGAFVSNGSAAVLYITTYKWLGKYYRK